MEEAYKIIEHRNGIKEIVPTTNENMEFKKLQKNEDDFRKEMKSLREEYKAERDYALKGVFISFIGSILLIMFACFAALMAMYTMDASPFITIMILIVITIAMVKLSLHDVKYYFKLKVWYQQDRETILKSYGLR